MFSTISKEDISGILSRVGPSTWAKLVNGRVFVTGGTGFIGTWILESLLSADQELDLGLEVTLLSRSPESFCEKFPSLRSDKRVHFLKGDVTNFEFPKGRTFTHVFHGANDSSLPNSAANPLQALDTMLIGTKRVLDFASLNPVKDFLLTSSGGVYGRSPKGTRKFSETSLVAPNPMEIRSIYGEGKRVSELLCTSYAAHTEIRPKIARIFALAGPYLPLDSHFALGNFIRDASLGKPIQILSDGRPLRSYLYASDLAVWLMRTWLNGKPLVPYHIGSEEAFSLKEIAHKVVKVFEKNGWAKKGHLKVKIAKKPKRGEWVDCYVPETKLTRAALKVNQTVSLEQAIAKTKR